MGETNGYLYDYKLTKELQQPYHDGRDLCFDVSVMKFLSLDLMKYEELRLATLMSFPRENKPDIVSIAVAGFYFAGDGEAVSCYCCGLTLRGLTAIHNPIEIHSRKSKYCRFINQNQEVNKRYFKPTRCEVEIIKVFTPCDEKETETQFTHVKDIDETEAYQEEGYSEHLERNQIVVSAAQPGRKIETITNGINTKQPDEYLDDNQEGKNIVQLKETNINQEIESFYNEPSSIKFAALGISLRGSVFKTGSIPDSPIDLKEKKSQRLLKQNEEEFVSLHEKQTNKRLNEPSVVIKDTEIGSGAFGRCFKVMKAESGTFLARKEIDHQGKDGKTVLEDARNEFFLLRSLCHPNIIRVLWETFDRDRDKYNIVMEYMPGGSVGDLLKCTENGLKEPLIIIYTKQILHGLSCLHSRRILHRDLKGENLLLTGNYLELKIGDFGSATEVVNVADGIKEKCQVGTVPFMAPEVAIEHSYTGAGDVWSVGCCMIQMATAKLPWNAEGFCEGMVLYQIGTSSKPPPIPNRMSPSLKRLAKSCLAITKEARPSTEELLNNQLFIENREDDYRRFCELNQNIHETV